MIISKTEQKSTSVLIQDFIKCCNIVLSIHHIPEIKEHKGYVGKLKARRATMGGSLTISDVMVLRKEKHWTNPKYQIHI